MMAGIYIPGMEMPTNADGCNVFLTREEAEAARMVVGGMTRWIPVTERLPDKSGNYLTAFADGTAMAVNEFMHPRGWLTEEGRKANPNGKWYWGGVTHWMPLPEPPLSEPPKEDTT